jgi:hypothetical protein
MQTATQLIANPIPFSQKSTTPSSTTGEQPQIHVISPKEHRKDAFRRITIATTSTPLSTLKSSRTHPVWHNPNFIPTLRPLQVVSSTTTTTQAPSPLIQHHTHPKWVPWWKRNQTQATPEHRVLQVSSMLQANIGRGQKGVKHPVKTRLFVFKLSPF